MHRQSFCVAFVDSLMSRVRRLSDVKSVQNATSWFVSGTWRPTSNTHRHRIGTSRNGSHLRRRVDFKVTRQSVVSSPAETHKVTEATGVAVWSDDHGGPADCKFMRLLCTAWHRTYTRWSTDRSYRTTSAGVFCASLRKGGMHLV